MNGHVGPAEMGKRLYRVEKLGWLNEIYYFYIGNGESRCPYVLKEMCWKSC